LAVFEEKGGSFLLIVIGRERAVQGKKGAENFRSFETINYSKKRGESSKKSW